MIKNIDKFLSSRLEKNISNISFKVEDESKSHQLYVKLTEKGYRCVIFESKYQEDREFFIIAEKDEDYKKLIKKAILIKDPQELDQFYIDQVPKVLTNKLWQNTFISNLNKYFYLKDLLKTIKLDTISH